MTKARYICGTNSNLYRAMETYPSITLKFDRRHVSSANKPGTVEVLISYERGKLYVNTGVRVPSTSWNGDRVVNHSMAATYNKMISDSFTRVTVATSNLWQFGQFSLEALKVELKQEKSDKSPVEWICERIEQHNVRESTRMHHRALPKKMREFGGFKTWKDFTPSTIVKWDTWLHQGGITQGTVRNYHKRMKVYIRQAMRDGLLSSDPYVGFKVDRPKPAKRKYLTEEQRDALEARPLTGALAHARDLFIFQCYTGLSYSDLYEFKLVEEGGDTFATGERVKTRIHYKVLLLDKAKQILKRYKGELPVMTNQKYNYFLKIAATGIRDDITSHMGRHTFATWALKHDVPIEVISTMLAHTNISVTQIYAEQQQEHVNEEYRRLNSLKKKS